MSKQSCSDSVVLPFSDSTAVHAVKPKLYVSDVPGCDENFSVPQVYEQPAQFAKSFPGRHRMVNHLLEDAYQARVCGNLQG